MSDPAPPPPSPLPLYVPRIFLESHVTRLRLSFDCLKIMPSTCVDRSSFRAAEAEGTEPRDRSSKTGASILISRGCTPVNSSAPANVIRRMTGTNRDASSTPGALVACSRARSFIARARKILVSFFLRSLRCHDGSQRFDLNPHRLPLVFTSGGIIGGRESIRGRYFMRARVLYGLTETYPGRRGYKLPLSRYGIPSGRGRKIMNDAFAARTGEIRG